MPVTKELNSLSISDNKKRDGLTLLPWQKGKPLAWDVTVIYPLAVSYVSGYSPGTSAELAASRKFEKYANLPNSYIFHPIAFKNLGTLNLSAIALISTLERKISTKSNDLREYTFLFQCLAITLQRLTHFFCERILCVIQTSDHSSCF